jgi:hypothetical protein
VSKSSYRLAFIFSLFALSLLPGCGVTSTSLPSNLQPNGGPALSILTTVFPDAIQGRTYYLQISTTGGSGELKSCAAIEGTLPTGLGWSINPTQVSACILSGTVSGAAGSYSVVIQATDSSGTTAQLPYTLSVRNDFSICAGPAAAVAACSASSAAASVTSFPDAVEGRSYGVALLSQIVATNLNGTADTNPVGHVGEFGNGPFTSASFVSGLPPSFIYSVVSGQSSFAISSTAVGAPNTYVVTVSITDNPITVSTQSVPVVPARTMSRSYIQTVVAPVQLAQSLGTQWPDAVNGRAYGGSATGCSGSGSAACASAAYTASGGLGGYVWPATLPSSLAAITGMACAASGGTYVCSAAKVTAGSSTPGGASTTLSPSVTVTDTANTATPAATPLSDPLSTRTDALVVDAPLSETLTQATLPGANPASLLPAVMNRSYGVVGAPPTYTAAGGLGAGSLGSSAYEWCVKAGSSLPPAGLGPGANSISANCPTYAATGSSLALTASPLTGSANTYAFTMQLDDTGNISTPGSVSSGASAQTANTTLIVNPPLAATVTQGANSTPGAKILDGVLNRSYGVINGGAGAPIYTATGGLNSSGAYLWCIVSGSTLPAGLGGISTSCGPTTSTAASSVKLLANSITGSAGTYSYRVQADDGGNAAVPGTFALPAADSVVGPTSFTVHPQISINLNASPPPDAVAGRTYGSPARTDLIFTVPTGAGLAPITMTGTGFPTPIACPTTNGTQQLNCNSANSVVSGATSTGVITAADTANAATPAATTSTDPGSQRTTDTINVRAALSLAPPGGSLATAVVGRSWGQGTTCGAGGSGSCAAAVYAVANGLGGYSAGPVTAGPLSCAFTSTGTFTGNYTCSSGSVANSTPGAFVALTVSDTANSTTPSGSVSDNSMNLPINPELTFSAQPPTPYPDAVNHRSYGQALTGCSPTSACSPLVYTITSGSGLGGYSFTLNNFPSNFVACTESPANTNTCSSASVTATASATPYTGLSVTASDTANGSTPNHSITSNTASITIHPEMTFSAQPPTTFPDAVNPRSYGQASSGCSPNSTCSPLVYTITSGSGLGGYGFTPNNFPANFVTCTQNPANTNTCSSAGVKTTPSTTAYSSLSMTVSDSGNQMTASNSVTSNSGSVTVHPELSVTVITTSPVAAVTGRHYGSPSDLTCNNGTPNVACAPLDYQLSNGLGGYALTTKTLTTSADYFTCTVTSPNFLCSVGGSGIQGVSSASPYTLIFVGADTGNSATPSNTTTDKTQVLPVRGQLAVNVPNPTPVPDAVSGRLYGTGTGGGSQDLIYSLPSGEGIPPVSLAGSGFPAPISCTTQTNNTDSNASMHCNSGNAIVTGATATGTVTATDTGNGSTPPASATSDSGSRLSGAETTITVDPEIVIANQSLASPSCGTAATPCPLPNGQKNQPYSVLFTCQVPLGTGTCGGTGSPGNAAAQYTWSASSNNIAGTNFTTTMPVSNPTAAATLSGTPSSASSNETVEITVSDKGNATTPSCTTASTCPSGYFTANIVPSYAYVGANDTNAMALFDTSTGEGSVSLVGSAVTLGGAKTTPDYVAASPSGTYVYFADPTNNQVFIYNTLTGTTEKTVSSTQNLHHATHDTQAVAVMAQVVPTTGLTPDDVDLIVANQGSDDLDVIDANPASATYGTVTHSVAFSWGSYPGAGPVDLKIAPTFFVGGVRQTHGYVVREGGDEVCVLDAEPSSATFDQEIAAANIPLDDTDKCIPLGSASGVVPRYIDVSPDGLYAFVTETNGTNVGDLKLIDTNPNDSTTFETVIDTIDLTTPPAAVTLAPNPADGTTTNFKGTYTPTPIIPGSLQVVAGSVIGLDNGHGSITGTGISSGTVNYTTGAISVTFTAAPTTGTLVQVSSTFVTADPAGVRVSPEGQTVWVAGKDTGKVLGFETALVGTTQFQMVSGMSTPAPSTDNPIGIAFRPDGAFGLATLSGSTKILPFTTTAGTAVAATGLTDPWGIDHIPNPTLHIVTTALPAATHGQPYASSIVANGPNKYFTFADVTTGSNNLAGLGFTLNSDGQVTSTTANSIANSPGTYTLNIQVADQSQPVNNVVVQTVSLIIN